MTSDEVLRRVHEQLMAATRHYTPIRTMRLSDTGYVSVGVRFAGHTALLVVRPVAESEGPRLRATIELPALPADARPARGEHPRWDTHYDLRTAGLLSKLVGELTYLGSLIEVEYAETPIVMTTVPARVPTDDELLSTDVP